MSAVQHKPGRIDSTAFRRGVRAAKTGAANPYNGPALRDEWEAGREYARARGARTEAERAAKAYAHAQLLSGDDDPGDYARGYRAGMAAVDRTYDSEYMQDGHAALAQSTHPQEARS